MTRDLDTPRKPSQHSDTHLDLWREYARKRWGAAGFRGGWPKGYTQARDAFMDALRQGNKSLACQRADEIIDAVEARNREKSPGQIAYEKELEIVPKYHDGTPRRPWSELGPAARLSWERNPTPRRQLPGPKEGERQ